MASKKPKKPSRADLNLPPPDEREPIVIMKTACRTLSLALFATFDISRATDPTREELAIRSAVMHLRSVTFVLQRLTHQVDGFSDMYERIRTGMKGIPHIAFLAETRTEVDKRGILNLVYRDGRAHFADAPDGWDRLAAYHLCRSVGMFLAGVLEEVESHFDLAVSADDKFGMWLDSGEGGENIESWLDTPG